jgi:hypothetical protein
VGEYCITLELGKAMIFHTQPQNEAIKDLPHAILLALSCLFSSICIVISVITGFADCHWKTAAVFRGYGKLMSQPPNAPVLQPSDAVPEPPG